jgi:hypothetical protein
MPMDPIRPGRRWPPAGGTSIRHDAPQLLVSETSAIASKAINMRSPDIGCAVNTKVSVSRVVCHDEHYVRPHRVSRLRGDGCRSSTKYKYKCE